MNCMCIDCVAWCVWVGVCVLFVWLAIHVYLLVLALLGTFCIDKIRIYFAYHYLTVLPI